jgi:phosphoglycerate kinase
MKLKSIREVKNLKGKTVLVRVGFDVPIKNGKVIDDFRIRQGLKTILYLLIQGARVIVINHIGRPNGKIVPALSNRPVAQKIAKLTGLKVILVTSLTDRKTFNLAKNFTSNQLLMLENLRFDSGEEANQPSFAKELSLSGDLYVNDAFSVSHRAQASVSAITKYLPSYAGLLLEKEINNLNKVLESKVKPKVAIIGGAKLETKVKVIKNLLRKMDYVLVGGAIANNFIKAKGYQIGKSLCDIEYLKIAKQIACQKLIIPVDAVVADKISAKANIKIKTIDKIGSNDIILDIGSKSIKRYLEILSRAKMVVWNGPLGYFEINQFKKASVAMARFLSQQKSDRIIGGGETVELINNLNLTKKFTFISTGGGAMLEFLEGKTLPGIKPLLRNK